MMGRERERERVEWDAARCDGEYRCGGDGDGLLRLTVVVVIFW